jgi:TPR repeat protein
MKVLVSVFLAIALLLGPAACTSVETREQRFANTEKKAARGDAAALYSLGLMFEQGYGVVQDKYQAAWCYRKAAEKGHIQAQYRLSYLYPHGQGVPRDFRQATECYEKAAEPRDPEAQAAFGNMPFSGESVHRLAKEKPRKRSEELF